jgi:hypothetical protein
MIGNNWSIKIGQPLPNVHLALRKLYLAIAEFGFHSNLVLGTNGIWFHCVQSFLESLGEV